MTSGSLTTVARVAPSARVIGVDRSPAYVRQARSAQAPLTIGFLVGSAERLPFRTASFDRALSLFALNFVPNYGAAVREMARVHELGHRGVVWGGHPETYGLPRLADPHWEPVWSQAEDLGLSINFHIDSASARLTVWEGYESQQSTKLIRHVPASIHFGSIGAPS